MGRVKLPTSSAALNTAGREAHDRATDRYHHLAIATDNRQNEFVEKLTAALLEEFNNNVKKNEKLSREASGEIQQKTYQSGEENMDNGRFLAAGGYEAFSKELKRFGNSLAKITENQAGPCWEGEKEAFMGKHVSSRDTFISVLDYGAMIMMREMN